MKREYHPRHELDREAVEAYARVFIPRFDRYPLQKNDGSYVAVHEPLSPDDILSHLYGMKTIGAYALNERSIATWICFDADDEADSADMPLWTALRDLSRTLDGQGVPSYAETSRRGGHLWLFTPPLPGIEARRFGRQLLAEYKLPPAIELYPKQDTLRTGPGSLVRLPLGIHRGANPPHRFHFVLPNGVTPLAPSIREQVRVLASPQRVPQQFVTDVLTCAPESKPVFPTKPFKNYKNRIVGSTPSERIKNRVSVYDFVSQYVELDRNGRGLCPFHDDHRMSFGVHQEKNFWNCFAGCGGGSIIDFWTKWQELHGQSTGWNDVIIDLIQILNL